MEEKKGRMPELRDYICGLELSADEKQNYRFQGRAMAALHIPKWLAYYPSDTWVGQLRMEGYQEIEVKPSRPDVEIGRIVQSYPPPRGPRGEPIAMEEIAKRMEEINSKYLFAEPTTQEEDDFYASNKQAIVDYYEERYYFWKNN